MKNLSSLNWKLPSVRWLFSLFALLGVLSSADLHAQNTANYAFTTSTTGSLVDMSTGTTQLIAPGVDASSSGVIPIGFDFYLMGARFTQFSVNEDGVMQLGGTGVGTNIYTITAGSAGSPRLAAFNSDLRTGTNGKVHYKVTGAAPNRQLIVEFQNMQLFYTTSSAVGTSTYQMVISETSGKIEYIYGAMSASTITAGNRSPSIGFHTGAATGAFVSVNYSASTASVTAPYSANPAVAATGDIPNLNSAANGSRRVYTFTPPVPASPAPLTFTGVGLYTTTLNWTDNATDELGYVIYRSLDGITYSFITQLPANTVLYNAAGLNSSTNYFWKVAAVSEGALNSPDATGNQVTASGTLSGVKTVGSGGDYTNLTTAFAAINSSGLGGDIELQMIAGYPAAPETYPIASSNEAAVGSFRVDVYPTVAGLSITSANTTGTLNLNNGTNITFDGRVNQAGANDLVIANTNTGTSYAVLFNNDARNNTLTHCIIQSTNTSSSSGTIVIGTTTGTNGNDNNTIENCEIRDGATTPSNAIYSVGTTTTAAHYNDNVTISNNNISNFFSAGSSSAGVVAGSGTNAWTITDNRIFQTATRTYTSGSTHNGIQVNNTNGNGYVITGNTIGFANAAGTGVYTMAGTIATRFIGINVSAGTALASSVQGNTISGFSLTTSSGAGTGNGIFAGINITNGNVNAGNVTPNTIGAATGTGAISATTSTSGGLIVGINSSSSGTVNISNNAIGSLTGLGSSATVSACITGVQVSAGAAPVINGNTIGSTTTANSINSSTAATSGEQYIRGINVNGGSGAISIQSNTIANMNQNGTTAGATGVKGISCTATGTATISLNTIYNLSGASANTGSASTSGTGIQGIFHAGAATGGAVINRNTIYNLSATNTGTVQSNVNGIGYGSVTGGSITNNRISDLRNASTMAVATTPPTASGILIQSGVVTSVTLSNNMISLGDAQATNTEFIGIWNAATSAGTLNAYHNSVSISGTAASGALPSYGILRGANVAAAVTTPVDIRNNIFSNTRSGGTGNHYAIANQSTTASATGWGLNASNYNVLNASAATVGLWGSTDESFNAWRLAASGDANSFSGIPLNFTGVPTGDLHLAMAATPTPMESGGAAIASVTVDYDNEARPGPAGSANGGATSPDLGADEFDGAPALPVVTLNSVTPPTAAQCAATARLVSVNVNNPAGVVINVSLAYSVNGVAQPLVTMTNTSGTTWEGTIPAATPGNATIAWGVSATNSSLLTGSYMGASYADEPLTGVTASATSSASPVCAGDASTLTAVLAQNVTATLGAGVSATTGSGVLGGNFVSPFSHYFGGYKSQYVIRASELTGSGLAQGNINSVAFDVSAVGSGMTYNGFNMSIAPTAGTVATATFITGAFTDVYSGNLNVSTTGLNTITFSTPFYWDGTSNIVVQLCWSNNNGGGGAAGTAEVRYDATSFVSQAYYRVDSQSASSVCGAATATNTQSNRPKLIFAANNAPAITGISWSDGATTVGATNPLTVNPTTTTTYTATVTASGCVVTPSPTTTVTVNPLPSSPAATNSAQCGSQLATASVASTTGAPTPTFNWYAASTGGTALQSGTSTTYSEIVASTTTFYVSEVDGTTFCESVRTPVTVTVASADPVSLTPSLAAVCLGQSFTLTAANTNPTPFQSYTYSTISTTDSGLESATAGTPITVTPTAAGTYVYTLTAVDGMCAGSTTASVTVNPLPVIAGITAPATVCSGSAIALSVTNTAGNTYSWSPGTGLNGASVSTTVTNNTGAPTTQVFTVTATITATGCMNTATTPAVTVNPSTAAPTAANSTQCGPGVPTASVTGSGAPGNTFSWFTLPAGGTAIAGQTGNTYTASLSATTTFYVSESNGTCASPRAEVTVTVTPPPAVTVSGPTEVCLGSSVALTANSSNGTYTYTWSDGLGTGATVNASPAVNTVYTVSAVDASGGANDGCNTTATYSITVNPVPAAVTASATDNTICTGEVVDLSSTANSNSPSVPVSPPLLSQNFDAGLGAWTTSYSGTAPATTAWMLQNAPFTYDGVMDFTSFATPQGGGFAMTNADLGASGLKTRSTLTSPSFSTSGMTAATLTFQNLYQRWASGDSIVAVQASTDGGTTWTNVKEYFALGVSQGTTTNNAQVMVNESITLGAAFMDQANVKIRFNYVSTWGFYWLIDDVVITGQQPAEPDYAWTSSPAGFTSAVQNPTGVAPTETTVYTVSVSNSFGCSATASTTVTVNALPAVDAGTDQTVCSGTTVTLAGAGATEYTWDNGVTDDSPFSATATTTYTVTGTDENLCSATDQVTVTVNDLPAANAGADQAVCAGTEVTLTATGTGTFSWDNDVDQATPFTPTATTTYTVTVDNGTCINTDEVTVTVNALPAVDAGDDQTVCSGTMITLAGAGATGYEWDNGITDNSPFPATATTTYTVTGTDANLCSATDEVTITVNTVPTATAALSDNVTLTASAGATYQWINCATGVAISGATAQVFTATANGSYSVEVTNASGCSDTSACISVTTVGIKEFEDASIAVYPNPTRDHVTISMSSESAAIQVLDAQGKLLQATKVSNGDKVDLSAYETGVYFLKITTDKGIALERVVKN